MPDCLYVGNPLYFIDHNKSWVGKYLCIYLKGKERKVLDECETLLEAVAFCKAQWKVIPNRNMVIFEKLPDQHIYRQLTNHSWRRLLNEVD